MYSNYIKALREKNTRFQSKAENIREFTALVDKNASRRTNNILQGCKISTQDKTVGLGSSTTFHCPHSHHFQLSPNLTHRDAIGHKYLDYDVNCKTIIQGYMNGAAGASLDTTGVLLDLPNAKNLTRNFSRHQDFIGEKIRDIVTEEMDLALQLELKATVIHEENEAFYEEWIKCNKKTRKKFGLTVSYDMGWQRRSSGNNYSSLSGHGFLIGAHTRRVIACVVFSKKCAVCESRKRKGLGAGMTAAAPAQPGAGITAAAPAQPGAGITAAAPADMDAETTVLEDITMGTLDSAGITATEPINTGVISTDGLDHVCTRNYDGSSGAMESDGLLLLMKQLKERYNGDIWLEYVITDDDTKMKKYISHPKYRPRGKTNIGGSLPLDIPEPKWYADPTHRAKCVAGSFFELCKGKKSDIRATKLDAFRMKKYYSYFIKQNRSKGLSWLREHAMAPLNHMFDDHSLCHSSWCHRKKKSDDEKEGKTVDPSERDAVGYYRCKKADGKLYVVMKEKYSRYVSDEFLTQCCHEHDTQMNEGLNRSVSKYVPKGTNFCTTTSLITRVYIAAGIQLVGNHFLWTNVMKALNLDIPIQTELYLLDLDKRKLRNFCREHDFANMAKRKKKEHEKIRAQIEQAKNDAKRNATYTSRTGCEIEEKNNKRKRSQDANVNICKYAEYGCTGASSHKTNRSKKCLFYGISHNEILGEFVFFLLH